MSSDTTGAWREKVALIHMVLEIAYQLAYQVINGNNRILFCQTDKKRQMMNLIG